MTRRLVGRNERGYRVGESHHRSKIPDATVTLMRDLHELQGLTFRDIAERLRLPFRTVQKICCYERRAQIPREWDDERRPR